VTFLKVGNRVINLGLVESVVLDCEGAVFVENVNDVQKFVGDEAESLRQFFEPLRYRHETEPKVIDVMRRREGVK
jgi:hypothetical protein